ncbi:MAG: DUF2961 domain-containing protein [Deltaproteobacteria bacterium]|nr:DUF2961 domain-containing protein [Deltaproteobacteria bacterium]
MTLPLTGQGPVLKDAVLRVYWDGESDPSIETPLGDFFGASFGRPRRLVSAHLVITGGAYLCRFEMPFNTGARIEVENQGSRPLRHLFFQVGYLEEPARTTPGGARRGLARRAEDGPAVPGVVVTPPPGGPLPAPRLRTRHPRGLGDHGRRRRWG